MYEAFFGLREPPFSLTPDTSYFHPGGGHRDALEMLLAALSLGEGFLKVTGEVGTGKTLLCRKLLDELAADARWVTAWVPNPALTPSGLRHVLAAELGRPMPANCGQHRLVETIEHAVLEHRRQGRAVVLVVDEAQALSRDCLEALRLFGNLETEKRKLLQIVLFGQPELDERLAGRDLRQLAQRIGFSEHLAPLDRAATADYLRHRLEVAGHRGRALFGPAMVRRLHRASGGIPRRINQLAHKTLLAAYGEGRPPAMRHLARAIEDTLGPSRTRRPGAALPGALALLGLLWAGGAGT